MEINPGVPIDFCIGQIDKRVCRKFSGLHINVIFWFLKCQQDKECNLLKIKKTNEKQFSQEIKVIDNTVVKN